MAYDVTQIYGIVNDAAADALGKTAGTTKLDTTNFLSLGKQLSDMSLLDGWFGALAKRISKTVLFARTYEGKKRRVLRDEQEWGAFIQKQLLFSTDKFELRNLIGEGPKTNAFGDGSAPRTIDYLGWQIVKKYMESGDVTLADLFADTDSRKILNKSQWRPGR